MKRLCVLIPMLLVTLGFAGCNSFPAQYPIENAQNILIAGIDTDGEDIVVSILVDTIEPGGESGKEQIVYKLYVETGKTVFEAKRKFHTYTDKRISWYHTKYIVIGEKAAKEGIDRLLAFFCEDDETRLLFRLIVAKGMTAKDFLQQANSEKDDLGGYLDTLFSEVARTGKSREIHLINYGIYREMPWQSVYIPSAETYSNPMQPGSSDGEGETSGVNQNLLVKLEGFALFDEDKLAGYLNGEQAQGLNFINNDFVSANITVQDEGGNNISLEIMNSSTKPKPDFDTMSVTIEVDINSNLVEYQGREDVFDYKYIEDLEQKLNAYITGEIEGAILVMQQYGTDAAFIGDSFYHQNPVKWEDIKDDWKSVFTGLDFTVKVNSSVQCTYELTNALGK